MAAAAAGSGSGLAPMAERRFGKGKRAPFIGWPVSEARLQVREDEVEN